MKQMSGLMVVNWTKRLLPKKFRGPNSTSANHFRGRRLPAIAPPFTTPDSVPFEISRS